MDGKGCRDKGHTYERGIAIFFRKWWKAAKRGLQTRGGTAEAPDVDGTPWYVECKFTKGAYNPVRALEQARDGRYHEEDGKRVLRDKRPPLAVCKTNRKPTTVTLYLSDFSEMLDRLYEK
jgi:hypothetical protein